MEQTRTTLGKNLDKQNALMAFMRPRENSKINVLEPKITDITSILRSDYHRFNSEEIRPSILFSNNKDEGFTDWHESPPGKTDDNRSHQTEKQEINGDQWSRHVYEDGSYKIWKNDKEQ